MLLHDLCNIMTPAPPHSHFMLLYLLPTIKISFTTSTLLPLPPQHRPSTLLLPPLRLRRLLQRPRYPPLSLIPSKRVVIALCLNVTDYGRLSRTRSRDDIAVVIDKSVGRGWRGVEIGSYAGSGAAALRGKRPRSSVHVGGYCCEGGGEEEEDGEGEAADLAARWEFGLAVEGRMLRGAGWWLLGVAEVVEGVEVAPVLMQYL